MKGFCLTGAVSTTGSLANGQTYTMTFTAKKTCLNTTISGGTLSVKVSNTVSDCSWNHRWSMKPRTVLKIKWMKYLIDILASKNYVTSCSDDAVRESAEQYHPARVDRSRRH